jgi:isopentenyl-diphosphate delta-isomerase
MVEENVILVNHNDEQIGLMPKLEAHEKQFYIVLFQFCFKQQNEIMLQQRASQNTILPLLWTNTCCSHQRDGETNIQAGSRRLFEEMGFKQNSKSFFILFIKPLLIMV